jgi:4-hydroxybenzoate polyprenyltransferase
MAPNKPWGNILNRRQLKLLALAGLIPALSLGLYYALFLTPFLLPLGLAELFFLLSYNLELFRGKFHTDFWFATSWGFLPVLAGYVVQTNTVGWTSFAAGLFGFTTAFVEINASRPYKVLKREPGSASSPLAARLEAILKGIVVTVIMTAVFLLLRSTLG